MISYKATLEGINVKIVEESYTSKCSFLDNEQICKHESYKGRRTKRGLFKTSSGKTINADFLMMLKAPLENQQKNPLM